MNALSVAFLENVKTVLVNGDNTVIVTIFMGLNERISSPRVIIEGRKTRTLSQILYGLTDAWKVRDDRYTKLIMVRETEKNDPIDFYTIATELSMAMLRIR